MKKTNLTHLKQTNCQPFFIVPEISNTIFLDKKNRKIVFAQVIEHSASFGKKKKKFATLQDKEREGGGMQIAK